MDLLPIETWNFILSLLESNRDKFHLLITFKNMFKCSVSFDELADINKITRSQWFDNFNSIKMIEFHGPYPKNLKYIEVNVNNITKDDTCIIENDIFMNYFKFPEGITDLLFNCNFHNIPRDNDLFMTEWHLFSGNKTIYKYLPASLKYISFGSTIIDLRRNIKHITFTKEINGVFTNGTYFIADSNVFSIETIWDYDSGNTCFITTS